MKGIRYATKSPNNRRADLWRVHEADWEDLDEAVEHARNAFPLWSQLSPQSRSRRVQRFAALLLHNLEPLTRLNSIETGKTCQQSSEEMKAAISLMIQRAKLNTAGRQMRHTPTCMGAETYEPLGVCSVLLPASWPMLFGITNIAHALMAGNTLILKPNTEAPYSCLKICELAMQSFPPGVVQVLHSNANVEVNFLIHQGINMTLVDGSEDDTNQLTNSGGYQNSRIQRHISWGYGAVIVCEDIDIEAWVPKLAAMAFVNNGQSGSLAKRIYVHDAIYNGLKDGLVDHVEEKFVVGYSLNMQAHIGPLQNGRK